MSDDNETPPAVAATAPKATSGWSEQDRRTLIITIVGTLAANISTVILVGGAIALAHWQRSGQTENAVIAAGLGGVGLGLFFAVIGLVFRRMARWLAREPGPPVSNAMSWVGWGMIGVGCLWALTEAMILLGVVAGVK
jgi:hypothetical protein